MIAVDVPTSEVPTTVRSPRTEAWDGFVEHEPGGSFRQTTAWAKVKAFQGWRDRRFVLVEDGDVVAGAQVLVRPLPLVPALGSIAYCGRGPLTRGDDPILARHAVAELHRLCRRERVRVLVVQPPLAHLWLEDALRAAGHVPSPVAVAPRATARVDLRHDLATLEGGLGRSLRKHLRRAERRGVVVRHGSRADLDTFHRLLTASSERVGYPIFPPVYYQRMWDAFAPTGRVELLLASHDGEDLSAQLCIVANGIAYAMAIGWSGAHAELHPNEVLDWYAIRWARARGLTHYDLESIEVTTARAIAAGADLATVPIAGSDRYKLKWGTEAVVFPGASLYVPSRFARAVLRRLPLERLTPPSLDITAPLRSMRGARGGPDPSEHRP